MVKHGEGARGERAKKKSIKAKVTSAMNSARRRSRMGKRVKKGLKGAAANYVSRGQALKKLQITLKDFRRLCILKGVYPRDPKKRPEKKQRADKVYYHIKDVAFLAHEPLLDKFRDFKAFMKKVRRAAGRKETDDARRLYAKRPEYSLDHLVKERYPRFQDALADMDDALCLVHLYAALPGDSKVGGSKAVAAIRRCAQLVRQWNLWVAESGSLRKVFVSVKGVYYQADVQGTTVTWLQPHAFNQHLPDDVDFRVMGTFLEFYDTFLRFVLYKLFEWQGMAYPPAAQSAAQGAAGEEAAEAAGAAAEGEADAAPEGHAGSKADKKRVKALKKAMRGIEQRDLEQQQQHEADGQDGGEGAASGSDEGDEDEDEDGNGDGADVAGPLGSALRAAMSAAVLPDGEADAEDGDGDGAADGDGGSLFRGLRIFCSREVPEWVRFVASAMGAAVGHEGAAAAFGASDAYITHVVVDRPALPANLRRDNVDAVQPQWIFDSLNNRTRLPASSYAVGKTLPPHLSPFVDDAAEGYVPSYAQELRRIRGLEPIRTGAEEEKTEEEREQHELAKSMMHKKSKRLYDRMKFGDARKQSKVDKLEAKRRRIEGPRDA